MGGVVPAGLMQDGHLQTSAGGGERGACPIETQMEMINPQQRSEGCNSTQSDDKRVKVKEKTE